MECIHAIYLITVGEKKYVGSTNNLYMRMSVHKSMSKHGSMRPVHVAIRENGMKYSTEVLEWKFCSPKDAHHTEQQWMERLKPELNLKRSEGMSSLEYAKKYYLENKEKCQEYQRKRAARSVTCGCGVTYKGPHNRRHHEKTAVHRKNIELLQDEYLARLAVEVSEGEGDGAQEIADNENMGSINVLSTEINSVDIA